MGHEAVTNKGYTSFIMTASDKLEIPWAQCEHVRHTPMALNKSISE